MRPVSNLDLDDDDYEEDITVALSRASISEDGNEGGAPAGRRHHCDDLTVVTGYNSQAHDDAGDVHIDVGDTNLKTIHGVNEIVLPYLLKTWHDADPKDHCSIQVHLLSGRTHKNKLTARVSTCGHYLVLEGNFDDEDDDYDFCGD